MSCDKSGSGDKSGRYSRLPATPEMKMSNKIENEKMVNFHILRDWADRLTKVVTSSVAIRHNVFKYGKHGAVIPGKEGLAPMCRYE